MAGASWRVVRKEKSLLAFPVLAAAFGVGYTILVVVPLSVLGFVAFGGNGILGFVLLAISLLGMNIGATFFGVAAASNASRVLNGEDPKLGDGIRVARSRLKVIIQWGLVSATVGLVLQAISDRVGGLGGALIQMIGGAAWSIASFFVLPILALEGLGPFDAIKQSLKVVREKWGESIIGGAVVGLIPGLIAFAGIAVAVLGVVAGSGVSWVLGVPLIVIGVVVLVAAITVGQVLHAVFTVVVYRYATEGVAPEGFSTGDLDAVFRSKK
jgi:Family of unknown function (DUF6159)